MPSICSAQRSVSLETLSAAAGEDGSNAGAASAAGTDLRNERRDG
jgi:hypothetical protein